MQRYISTNPYDKETETVDWLDYECDQVHKYNEALRAAGKIR